MARYRVTITQGLFDGEPWFLVRWSEGPIVQGARRRRSWWCREQWEARSLRDLLNAGVAFSEVEILMRDRQLQREANS